MTEHELKALRLLLFYTRHEAATIIAAGEKRPSGVSQRAWRMWEKGEITVPDDISATIHKLVAWRQSEIDTMTQKIDAQLKSSQLIKLAWYDSAEAWQNKTSKDILYWRPYQSVVAEMLVRYGKGVVLAD